MSQFLSTDECSLLHDLRQSQHIFDLLSAEPDSEFRQQALLRRQFPDAVVRAALTLNELREKGRAKFSRADAMWFDRKGLEQATAEPVARHKARRFHGHVWDFCSGIGGDALALAQHCSVTTVDVNTAACLRTKWNGEVYGVTDRLRAVNARVEDILDRSSLLHVDPDRRLGGTRRLVRVEDYTPGLEFLTRVVHEFPGGAIKLSPAANFGGKFSGCEIELISFGGECKEATVWFGQLAGTVPYRATVLPAGQSLAGNPLDVTVRITTPGAYLYDPDPAVVRAGLVDLLASQLGLNRTDDAEEYLTSDALVDSPFVRSFEVLDSLPNNDRDIRRYFRGADFGQVEIKSRHVRIDAQSVRRKLPLDGSGAAVLIYARIASRVQALVCRRIG